MEDSVLTAVDDLALAQAMIRVWGWEAALKASDNASTQTFMGNDAAAQKWHRVMSLIASVIKTAPQQLGAADSETGALA